MPSHARPVAWVESPLQLVGAAEWAHAHGTRIDLAGRLAPQVEQTAAELVRRGALFADQAGYWGIPWRMLAAHDHWLVGDGFSGQFRLAAAVLRPKRITLLDDGLKTLPLCDALTGHAPYARPGIAEGRLTRTVAPFALDLARLRAAAGNLDVFTAFDLGAARIDALADLGASVEGHAFAWLRGTRPTSLTRDGMEHERIVLGSAAVVDGLMPLPEYVSWVAGQAAGGALYLPHRRESLDQIAAVASSADVAVVQKHLPIEVVLAGTDRPRDIVSLPSSAVVTLRLVLNGTGSVVRELAPGDVSREESAA